MIGISLCVILTIFHVEFSQQIPQHCKEAPRGVGNPRDCCKSESIFSEEDFEACDIDKPQENVQSGVSDCTKTNCLMNRHNLMQDDNSIDKEALAAFLDKYVEKNTDFKDIVESVKEVCLTDDLLRSGECPASNIVFCTSGTMFMSCPTWADTDNCKKLKKYFDDCKNYLM